jgi:hypothetical protein
LSKLYFFAGPEDTRALAAFFLERKLSLVSTRFDDDRDVQADNFVEQPGCFVSPVPLAEIERSQIQKNATDPLIRDIIHPFRQPVITWRRSSIDGDYLIAGDLEWVDWTEGSTVFASDPRLRQLNAVAGKAFRSARRWMQKNWTIDNGFWLGPQALKLRASGLKTSSFHPDKVTTSTVVIGNTRH